METPNDADKIENGADHESDLRFSLAISKTKHNSVIAHAKNKGTYLLQSDPCCARQPMSVLHNSGRYINGLWLTALCKKA